jgi:tetratricopeptide (TPR) repeat protein
VQEGDDFEKKTELEKARDKYKAALNLKPDDAPTKAKLEKVEKAINEKLSAAEQEKAKRRKYEELITEAGNDFNGKKWEQAKAKYTDALKLYPDEVLPKNKLAEIEQFMKAEKAAEEANKKLKEYKDIIAQADGARNAKQWGQG